MTVDPEVRIGTISHGTHSIDYFTHYFSLDMIHQTQWKSSRVMFVFEAPASNLGASYGFINKYECFDSDWEKRQKIKKEHIKEFLSEAEKWEEPEAFSNLLSYHRWWLDRTEKTEEESCNWTNDMARHLQQGKEYCYSITTLMKIFGLANIYTTNIMRFELYKGANKGNEVSLNWNNAQKLRKSDNGESVIDIAYKDIFLKEIEKFKPDIIFATANPCNYLSWEKRLKNDLKKKEFEFEYDIPICKIPHPANQKTTNEHRLCLNICFIAKMLAERGIITYDEAQEAIYTYYLSLRMK